MNCLKRSARRLTQSGHRRFASSLLALLLCPPTSLIAADIVPSTDSRQAPPNRPLAFAENLSFRQEIDHAIERGLGWLATNQNPEGWWSTPAQPAVTALALTAFNGQTKSRSASSNPQQITNGYRWLLTCVQPDGGIHRSNLVTYNTALSMNALVAARNPQFDPILRRARRFLVGLQRDFDEKGKTDNIFDGGIGYGSSYEHSDMGNTLAALEAIHNTRHLLTDERRAEEQDLNWAAAIHFLQNCQNFSAYNKLAWVSDDDTNKGGFVYYPGRSMAGGETNSVTGRVALRSYGSISYGGLLSYIYANLKHDDPRVVAVFDWLRRNYTLTENPGMGPQGLYYYFHTMTKALTAYDVKQLELQDSQKIDWRHELAMRLINLQQRDGSWSNDNGRWWEKDPALVTSYVVLSLEMISQRL